MVDITIERRIGCEFVGMSSYTKPDHAGLAGFRFYEVDTGLIYYHTGVVWTPISGYAETESYSNKTITATDNTITGLATQSSLALNAKRTGSFIPAVNGPALIGALGGMLVSTGASENPFSAIDDNEGNYQNFRGNLTTEKMGIQSTSSTNSMNTTFGQNPYVRFRLRLDNTAGIRFYFGYTSLQALPASNTPLGSADSGVIIGFGSSTANFTIYNNDGSTTAQTADFETPTAKNAAWHNFTIDATGNNVVVCSLDDTNSLTLGSRIPANATTLYFNCVVQYV